MTFTTPKERENPMPAKKTFIGECFDLLDVQTEEGRSRAGLALRLTRPGTDIPSVLAKRAAKGKKKAAKKTAKKAAKKAAKKGRKK